MTADLHAALASADQRQISGDLSGAIALYDHLLAGAPWFWPAHANRALAYAVAGDLPAARAGFKRALAIEPSATPALRNLADSLQQDRPEAGRLVASAWIAAAPDSPDAWLCLGCIQSALGSTDAGRSLRRAVVLSPSMAPALVALTGAVGEHKPLWLRRATHCEPTPLALLSLARHLVAAQDRAGARILLRRALALAPSDVEAVAEMSAALDAFGATIELVRWGLRAVMLAPDSAAAWNNLGTAQLGLGRLDDACRSLEMATSLRPDFPEAHFNRATPLFLLGRTEEAWAEYEWRWRIGRFERPPTTAPRWDGRSLEGGTLLVHDEQGLGDALQFARYVPDLRGSAEKIVLACDHRLVRLFQAAFPDVAVTARSSLPPHDVAVPLLSLPRLLPGGGKRPPYLIAPHPMRIEAAGRLRVGLIWAGNPAHPRDAERSLPLPLLSRGLELDGVAWFSLQVGSPRSELAQNGLEDKVPDLGRGLGDLLDTAAILAGLDLLITVDTAACHLAGALAVPVWTLVSWLPDWRWGMRGDTTPWYPSMRLYRQQSRGEWTAVIDSVRADLANFAGSQRS